MTCFSSFCVSFFINIITVSATTLMHCAHCMQIRGQPLARHDSRETPDTRDSPPTPFRVDDRPAHLASSLTYGSLSLLIHALHPSDQCSIPPRRKKKIQPHNACRLHHPSSKQKKPSPAGSDTSSSARARSVYFPYSVRCCRLDVSSRPVEGSPSTTRSPSQAPPDRDSFR